MAVNRRDLHGVLLAAFPDPGVFRQLIDDSGQVWGRFAGANLVLAEVITNVIAKAETEGWTLRLLAAAADSSSKDNPQLKAFFVRCPELDPANAPAAPPDPIGSMTLIANRPFVGRPGVRQCLRVFGTANQSRVLLVDGPEGSGKSYTHDFFEYLATFTGCRLSRLRLDGESLTLEAFVERLREKVGLPLPPNRNNEQDARWAERLVEDWLLKHSVDAEAGKKLWLVLDGFARQEHATGVYALIDKLCEMVDGAAASQAGHFGVVLLSYGARAPETVAAAALDESIDPPAKDDFRRLLAERHQAKGQTAADADLALEEIYAQAELKAAKDTERRPVLYWINLGITRAMKRLNL